ncbi:hypothetical protein [Pseudoxanthomonas putridarboris]|uniref:Uncharacterized protein n=1 Tax=Pseudoxanthomonas putridarboris TaxID=752605 RepID=A0ABU9IZ77_9GAMM
MNACNHIALALLSAAVGLAAAPIASAGPDGVPAHIVIDCAHPRLPSQREVGELLGQHNFSQVYASRTALMGEARRACLRSQARSVRVVFDAPAARTVEKRRVADNRRRR